MPNTKDEWLTTATVYDEDRAALWRRVFDQPEDEPPEIPIASIIPIMVQVPDHDTPQRAYELDWNAITTQQRMRLIKEISECFQLDPATVQADIQDVGVPILAEDVVVSSRDRVMVRMLL